MSPSEQTSAGIPAMLDLYTTSASLVCAELSFSGRTSSKCMLRSCSEFFKQSGVEAEIGSGAMSP